MVRRFAHEPLGWRPTTLGDPLYSARRTLHTGADLLTDKQKDRLVAIHSSASSSHFAGNATDHLTAA